MREKAATFDPDVLYRIRQFVGPVLTRLARALGQPEYRLQRSGYVGSVRVPMDDLVEALRASGFSWGPVSWYHQPPVEAEPNGSWTYRPSLLADRQLHVVLTAQSPEHVAVFAHEEYNWIRHPLKHARQVDIERERGVTEMRRWLDARGLDVTEESRLRRQAVQLLYRGRERLAAALGRS